MPAVAGASPSGWELYYRVVRRIPVGRVSTYGQIAALAGRPRSARHVGYAMAALAGSARGVPWHRVLGARPRGRAAVTIADAGSAAQQRLRLAAEGVIFDEAGCVSLEEFGWQPRVTVDAELAEASPKGRGSERGQTRGKAR